MKPNKIESYEAGYFVSGNVKKTVIATAAAATILGGLTGCFRNSISGDMEYQPPQYDGYMAVESVSDSDIKETPSPSSEDEMFTLDGDIAYIPSSQG